MGAAGPGKERCSMSKTKMPKVTGPKRSDASNPSARRQERKEELKSALLDEDDDDDPGICPSKEDDVGCSRFNFLGLLSSSTSSCWLE
jgi:hypothetical protein